MPDTTFATLLDRAQNVTETTPLRVPGDWMQGRAGYGGLVGALALKAMRSQVPAERKVRSLLIAFLANGQQGVVNVVDVFPVGVDRIHHGRRPGRRQRRC
jgi:acyl-CoA thioesterase